MRRTINSQRAFSLPILVVLLFSCLLPIIPAFAQQPSVQEIQGGINPGEIDVFHLPGLLRGQQLYLSMQTTSGNLDPALAIVPGDTDLVKLNTDFRAELQKLVQTSQYPLAEISALRDRYFLAWDDDSGPGYAAALVFTVPQDGDYILIASGSLSAAGRATSGKYRLMVGMDAPEVLSGKATPTGATIATPDDSLLGLQPRIQEYIGSLNNDTLSTTIPLYGLDPGDILSAVVQSTSGNLRPILVLRDYGGKPVQVGNLQGLEQRASLEHTFPEGGESYYLEINAAKENGVATSGAYRLLAGINAPQLLEGGVQPNSQDVLRLPIEVKVGLKLQQIVNIDQPNEIMNDVGTLKLEWTDSALAFNPDDCNCSSKLYTENDFNKFLTDVKGKWPDFTFFNQQGNRWVQNRLIEIEPDGHVTYLERFSTNFQIDFDWTAFPFDTQDFYIKVDMLYPEGDYVFAPMDGFSEIDPNNGEDEFILTDFDTQISSEVSSTQTPISRFTFHFAAPRHMDYYIFRVLVPILLIISVSYITFFLKDYTRRIEIATGNLLLFIAFSFSLGENYPRMGYLTFLDAIMAITFLINTLVVVLNVYFKVLEQKGQREKADRLEAPFNYIYPLAYLISFGLAALIFLV